MMIVVNHAIVRVFKPRPWRSKWKAKVTLIAPLGKVHRDERGRACEFTIKAKDRSILKDLVKKRVEHWCGPLETFYIGDVGR